MRRKKLRHDAKQIVIDRLGRMVDNLHGQAGVYREHGGFETNYIEAMREAADYLSDIRKGLQR